MEGQHERLMEIGETQDSFEAYLRRALLNRHIIVLSGEIQDEDAGQIVAALEYLYGVVEVAKEVRIILCSPGGSVFSAMAIYDTLKGMVRNGWKVDIEARGYAASMACTVLQAGTTRRATQNTRLHIHEVSHLIGHEERASDAEEEIEELKKVNVMVASVIAETSGHGVEEILGLIKKNRDCWFSADEALTFGIIDEIVGKEEEKENERNAG